MPYLVFCAKVKKPFSIPIMGVVVGLTYLATGQFHIKLPITFFITSIIAEIIRRTSKYESFWEDAIVFIRHGSIAATAMGRH